MLSMVDIGPIGSEEEDENGEVYDDDNDGQIVISSLEPSV